jgi:HEAT repeat protein/TolA-binding protein
MKHRSFILVALATIPFTAAVGQTVPPTPPAKPDPVVALPSQPVAPVPYIPATPQVPAVATPRVYIDRTNIDEIRRAADEARIDGQRIAEEVRNQTREITDFARIDGQRMAEDALRAGREAGRMAGIDAGRLADVGRSLNLSGQTIYAPTPFENDFNFNFDFNFNGFQSFNSHAEVGPRPLSGGMQGDPADSLYDLAREAFNHQDYARAATRFAELIAKYPNFRRIADAAYWEAFARYRVGTVDQLRLGLKVLETNANRFEYDSKKTDAPVLQARILRSLADRQEPGVDAKLRDLYARYPATSCDQDGNQIKAQVLSSLYKSDPDAAMPFLRDYLATRDACRADLRRAAVFLLADRPTDEKTNLIIQVARNDTVRDVRVQAIDVLSRMPSDAAINALQDLMRDSDERVQSAAVRSLMRSDNSRARTAMRALIDRRDAPERQRIEAIRSYDRNNTTPDDAKYLRDLYNRKDESDNVKDAVISALSQMPSEENVAFLLGVAQNSNESSSLRSRALRAVSRGNSIGVNDLIKLYDASDSRSMRQSLVQALSERKEDVAVNKLLDIARFSTDLEVRRYTIQRLLDKNDPAITKKVLDFMK